MLLVENVAILSISGTLNRCKSGLSVLIYIAQKTGTSPCGSSGHYTLWQVIGSYKCNRLYCTNMTRPMTGQPKTEEELMNATQKANAELSKMLENGEITKGFDDEDENDEKTREEKREEMREFKENSEAWDELKELEEEHEQATTEDYNMVRNKNKDEKEMKVVDDSGEVHTLTREDVENRRDVQTRVWDRLERNGGVFVRVARWFNDAEINKVKTGRGFYGQEVGETEKALQIEVSAEDGNHNAGTETVWIPKKAATTYELE